MKRLRHAIRLRIASGIRLGILGISKSLLSALLLIVATQTGTTHAQIIFDPPNKFEAFVQAGHQHYSYVPPGTPPLHWLLTEPNGRWATATWSDHDGDGYPDTVNFLVWANGLANLSSDYPLFFTFSSARTGKALAAGTYDEAETAGRESEGHPGMDIMGNCSRQTGSFTILQAEYDPHSNRILHFAVGFTQHCNGTAPAFYGTLTYQATQSEIPLSLISPTHMPDAGVDQPYSFQNSAYGGFSPYAWKIIGGHLPSGLSLTDAGEIRGTPTQVGDFDFALQLSDTRAPIALPNQTVAYVMMLSVKEVALSVTSASPPNGVKGAAYTHQFRAEGGKSPYAWSVPVGQLPQGLVLQADGTLSGVPTGVGLYGFTLQVADSASHTARREYSVRVIELPVLGKIKYKAGKHRLIISGEKFTSATAVYLDGRAVTPASQDEVSITVNGLPLEMGTHTVRVVNPDGGEASRELIIQ